MSRDPRLQEEDDGRTIVDMSGVERPNLFSLRIPSQEEKARKAKRQESESAPLDLTPTERNWAILGMLKAAFFIAVPYLVGLGGIILLMDLLF